MLESQTPKLRRLPAGLAYVRPALIAFKYGENDDLAEYWATQAKSAGNGQARPKRARSAAAFLGHALPAGPL